ncbi:MAG: hypothetical protein LUD02_14290 [Tannerellaceae bacterium]|nr:hypothetical protein [Tannerellaceae bacterium]
MAATVDGNILFSYSKGAKLITKTQKEIWDIAALEGCKMQSAKVLPNGNFLLAWCGHPATILEVNPKGAILKQTEFETGIENPHSQFRQVSKNKNGNYILPLMGRREVLEITPDGEPVRSMKVPGSPFSVAELDNGHYLVACGDAHTFVKIDLNKDKIIRQVGAEDIEGMSLRFVAQLLPTAHDGLYLCNWQGHGTSAGDTPQLVELDGSGRIVWSLNDNHTFGMISAVCPID